MQLTNSNIKFDINDNLLRITSFKGNIDKGKYNIDTGIGFLNHMIEQLSHHSSIDIDLKIKGDLDVDFHHVTEDSAIGIALAIKEALGDKKNINRYGSFYIPMDETLTRCVIDLSGRIYNIFNVEFKRDKVGEMDTELFREWFLAFCNNLGCNLHIENLYGVNCHHIVESCFKALARSLKIAITIDDKNHSINSTKGKL